MRCGFRRWQARNVQTPEVIRPSFVLAGQRRQPQSFLNRKREPMYGSAGIDGDLRAPHMAVISVSRLPGGPGSHKLYLSNARSSTATGACGEKWATSIRL